MKNRNVEDWVAYIQTLHAREIEMSLDRVRSVFQRLLPDGCPFTIVSVAGTNGKGSTTELIASIYRAAGFKSAKFTSPHLIDFNERFNIDGRDVSDADLIAAFERIENARGDIPITYFEYGVLLAVTLFAEHKVEIAVMEVGLGGRLDAVNILDADVAIVTSISMDHADWLGDTLEKIAYEKAGIARANRPCIVGVRKPQASLQQYLTQIDALAHYLGQDFDHYVHRSGVWRFDAPTPIFDQLPLPFNQDDVQLDNAALAIKAVQLLADRHNVDETAIRQGLSQAKLLGRCQIVRKEPLTIVDVSHNEASVRRLARELRSKSVSGRLVAICGMLKDKEIGPSLLNLLPLVNEWRLASIDHPRGSTAVDLAKMIKTLAQDNAVQVSAMSVHEHNSVVEAYQAVEETLTADDCLVVFGSFYIAGDILAHLRERFPEAPHSYE